MVSVTVSSLLLVGLFSCTLANPATTTVKSPATTVGAQASTATVKVSVGLQDILSESDKSLVCAVNVSAPLCASAGANDSNCAALAAAVKGTKPCCEAVNVCSFVVPAPAADATTTTTKPGQSTTSTQATTTTHAASAGTTLLPIKVSPCTVYVSVGPVPSNVATIKACPNCKTTFVFPKVADAAAAATTAATTTTTVDPKKAY